MDQPPQREEMVQGVCLCGGLKISLFFRGFFTDRRHVFPRAVCILEAFFNHRLFFIDMI